MITDRTRHAVDSIRLVAYLQCRICRRAGWPAAVSPLDDDHELASFDQLCAHVPSCLIVVSLSKLPGCIRCAALTKAGHPCARRPSRGQLRCAFHAGVVS